MSVTQIRWSREQCRVENGIFFADDTVILLRGHPRRGYVASHQTELLRLLEDSPDGWTDIDENPACRVEAGGVIVTAGATSWEGEGFVAAWRDPDGGLLWVLHLSESEVFSELRYDGDTIQAVSTAYPDAYLWRIPVSQPQMLSVIVNRAI